jgi:hypothetical protein
MSISKISPAADRIPDDFHNAELVRRALRQADANVLRRGTVW